MSNTSFQQGDACKLDFPDEPFRLSDSHGKEVVDDLDGVAFCVGNLYYFRIVFKSSLHADVEVFFFDWNSIHICYSYISWNYRT